MKFEDVKVGMNVKIIKNEDGKRYNCYVGTIGKVIDTYGDKINLKLCDGIEDMYWSLNEIEPYKEEPKLNYIEQVAKMLGVEIGEKFNVKYKEDIINYSPCYFKSNGLFKRNGVKIHSCLEQLIEGEYQIEKIIPYAKSTKVRPDSVYYFITSNGVVGIKFNQGETFDYAMYALGNMFDTDKIPQPQIDEMVKKLKGDEV